MISTTKLQGFGSWVMTRQVDVSIWKVTQVTPWHYAERNPTSARTDIPGCNSRARLQNCYDRGVPPFYLSSSRVCASMQARERDAEAHRAHERRRCGRAEVSAQRRVKGQQEKVALQTRKRVR